MPAKNHVKEFKRAQVLRAWNLSAETAGDVENLIKRARLQLDTKKAIQIRHALLAMTAKLASALKKDIPPEEAIRFSNETLDALDNLSSMLESMVDIKDVDVNRLKVVVSRLKEIKKLLGAPIELNTSNLLS